MAFKIQNTSFALMRTVYTFLLEPIHHNEEDHRKELVCNILLVFISLFLVILDVLVLINYVSTDGEYIGINPYLMFLITGSSFCLLYFSRIGYTTHVSHSIIWLLVIGGTYGQIMWGADLPSIILLWSLIITTSSILISTRYSFYLAIYIGIGTILLEILSERNILRPIEIWKTHGFRLDDAIEYAVIFILIAGVSWVSNREIYRSLKKVKTTRDELQRERDVLEIKVVERTELLHKAQIEKINSMYQLVEFGRISSGLFHDLITPLNTLDFSISQIKELNTPDTETYFDVSDVYSEHIQGIKNQLDQCIHVSKRLIEFVCLAKRQISQTEDERRFEICTEIKNTISILNSRARRNGIQILFSSQRNISILGSPTLFSHVMTNLISNAIDSYDAINMSKTSSTSTNQLPVRDHKILIYCSKKKKHVEIKVKDFGAGIPSNVQPHIFETFFTTKPRHGCGIGLSATKHTLEKNFKGTISFVSDTQLGTTFTIKIPIIKHEIQNIVPPENEFEVGIRKYIKEDATISH